MATRQVAVLPGYVFVRFPEPPDWALLDECVSAVPKLFKIFSHETTINGQIIEIYVPFLVKDEEIRRLKAREAKGTLAPPVQEASPLVNTQIRVPHGPFMGHYAKVKSVEDGVARVRLAGTILGRAVYLSIPVEDFNP